MKIYPLNSVVPYQQNKRPADINKDPKQRNLNCSLPNLYYNDFLINFGARVDKGLERFYDANKEHMPLTVKNYIEKLDDKSSITPLEAQKNAYEYLELAQTIEDIKSAYPDEKLFENLLYPLESRATRGILLSIKENNELLELGGQGVLKDKSNFTVYLVKKIFLENKTIEEINNDLEKDLDDDFRADFKFKNGNSPYVYTSTLKALGIKAPDFQYRQSLRYTVEGYSDIVGDKISEGQRAFWDSLSFEERTARAKKSILALESWWVGLTRDQILEMIAKDMDELELLKEFKKTRQTEKKTKLPKTESDNSAARGSHKHIKIGSDTLSQDELFIRWATNKLNLYKENLTEAEKDTIHIKRMRNLAQRWAEMTPAERTDYISKMKSGLEPLKYAMIDAWNNSTALIKDLSLYLRENQIYKPADLLYSTQEFSEFQSRIMTEFWETHPEHSSQLGKQITVSQEKIKNAISNGTFEALKKEILRDKNQRIKELQDFKASILTKDVVPENKEIPEYMKEFKEIYYKVLGKNLKNLPAEYIKDYFNVIQTDYTQEQIEAWTRNLKGERLSNEDYELLIQISKTESSEGAKINRALEGALANILYVCTGNAVVYKLSHSDLKVALAQVDRGEKYIDIDSKKLHQRFTLPIIKRKIDQHRISDLYRAYIQEIPEDELDEIISKYFQCKPEYVDELKEYLKTYGKTLNIIFSEKNAFPSIVKKTMHDKFIGNMPPSLANNCFCNFIIDREERIKQLEYKLSKRFAFVPSIYMDNYTAELGKAIRTSGGSAVSEAFDKACTKRTDPKATAKLAVLPKSKFSVKNAIRTLAMEQAIADILYNVTGNTDVYKLHFEELCDNIEIFNLVKKFPSETRKFNALNGDKIELTAHKRANTSGLTREYLEYVNEIIDWINTDVKEGKGTFDDLVCILNPDENMPQIDEAVSERIKRYNLNLK